MAPRVLVIDNYDSFVYNLVQYLGELGAEVTVVRNDEKSLSELAATGPDALLVSPGPGRPESAGVSNEAIAHFAEDGRPVLGVCLGLQCLAEVYGGTIVAAEVILHGKPSEVHHGGEGIFAGLPNPFPATRYHSLAVDRSSLPDELEVVAEAPDGTIMGLKHRHLDAAGVQFHPESILTGEPGRLLLANFLARTRSRSGLAGA